MQAGEENALNKVREEHCKQILERYRSKSRTFRTFLIVVVVCALVFFFAILAPYVFLQYEKRKIDERLGQLLTPEHLLEESISNYRTAQKGIKELQSKITNAPTALRHFILSLNRRDMPRASQGDITFQSAQTARPIPPASPCDSLEGMKEWVDCMVKEQVLSQFEEYRKILESEIVKPLKTLDGKETSVIKLAELKTKVEFLHTSFEEELEKNPRFWETVENKAGFSVKLNKIVKDFWGGFSSVIEGQSQKLEEKLTTLKREKDKLEEQQAELKSKEGEVVRRLDNIESPLGKLPVGINESVLVFPPVLAICFLIGTFLFCEVNRLRKGFHNMYQMNDPDRTILTNQQVALIAPMWIEPLKPRREQIFQIFIVLLPFMIFVAACGLIIYCWVILDTFPGAGPLQRWIWSGLYLSSLGIFIYGCLKVITELRHYLE